MADVAFNDDELRELALAGAIEIGPDAAKDFDRIASACIFQTSHFDDVAKLREQAADVRSIAAMLFARLTSQDPGSSELPWDLFKRMGEACDGEPLLWRLLEDLEQLEDALASIAAETASKRGPHSQEWLTSTCAILLKSYHRWGGDRELPKKDTEAEEADNFPACRFVRKFNKLLMIKREAIPRERWPSSLITAGDENFVFQMKYKSGRDLASLLRRAAIIVEAMPPAYQLKWGKILPDDDDYSDLSLDRYGDANDDGKFDFV
jgi:hypothetical protein